MDLIWIGALLFVAGLVYTALSAIRGGRGSSGPPPAAADETIEPRRPGRGFGLRRNWPGLALIALGVALMLGSVATRNSPETIPQDGTPGAEAPA